MQFHHLKHPRACSISFMPTVIYHTYLSSRHYYTHLSHPQLHTPSSPCLHLHTYCPYLHTHFTIHILCILMHAINSLIPINQLHPSLLTTSPIFSSPLFISHEPSHSFIPQFSIPISMLFFITLFHVFIPIIFFYIPIKPSTAFIIVSSPKALLMLKENPLPWRSYPWKHPQSMLGRWMQNLRRNNDRKWWSSSHQY